MHCFFLGQLLLICKFFKCMCVSRSATRTTIPTGPPKALPLFPELRWAVEDAEYDAMLQPFVVWLSSCIYLDIILIDHVCFLWLNTHSKSTIHGSVYVFNNNKKSPVNPVKFKIRNSLPHTSCIKISRPTKSHYCWMTNVKLNNSKS